MDVLRNVSLRSFNTLGADVQAQALVQVACEADIHALLGDATWRDVPILILGGGSNIVLTRDVPGLVLSVALRGRRLVRETEHLRIVEAAAGEPWHDFVAWTLDNGWPGLENLAGIPGTVGAAPVQNIGAYGVELQDRFDELDYIDLRTGQTGTLGAAECGFGYRQSIFRYGTWLAEGKRAGQEEPDKQGAASLRGHALITRVRFALPKVYQPVLGYADIEQRLLAAGGAEPDARTLFDWVCEIRSAKLPDPREPGLGNVGSFFKNPTVSEEQFQHIIGRHPHLVHYRLGDGTIKFAAAWMIDACGWKAQSMGPARVYARHAIVLVHPGGPAAGAEVLALARAIQASVCERFGVVLEIEPVVV
ncbi:UDP-N-acetylmuramate dehydrogenase [Candidatus Symbiobacter mobilis]|nr:UDP-N-acetylmuramate dehydrogenase [Candidatus Symbiobacter mobilis]